MRKRLAELPPFATIVVISLALALCLTRPAPSPPHDSEGMAALADRFSLHVVPVSPTCCYLSINPADFADLNALPRDESRLADWAGVVFCDRAPGEGVRVAGWTLFGDPELVRHVADALTRGP